MRKRVQATTYFWLTFSRSQLRKWDMILINFTKCALADYYTQSLKQQNINFFFQKWPKEHQQKCVCVCELGWFVRTIRLKGVFLRKIASRSPFNKFLLLLYWSCHKLPETWHTWQVMEVTFGTKYGFICERNPSLYI